MQTLPQLIQSQAAHSPEISHRELLRFVQILPDGTYEVHSRSYAQLWTQGQAIAKAMRRAGLQKGMRIAVMMENHAEFVDVIVAASILGVVLVPVDPRTRGEKLAYMLRAARCVGVICGSYCLEALAAIGDSHRLNWIWFIEDSQSGSPAAGADSPVAGRRLADVIGEADGEPDIASDTRLDDDMALMSTSGTTGDPKFIQCNYRRYALKGIDNCRWFDIRPDDVLYTGLSLTHGNAQNMSLAVSLYNDVPLVLSRKFTKTRLWQIVKDFDCTSMTMLGGMYSAIFAEPESPLDASTNMRLIVGAGMPQSLWQAFSRRYGVDILEFYSASEGGMAVNRPGEGPIGSMGRVVDGLIAEIFDDQDRPCPPGETGELVFRPADGSLPVVRYYDNPQASQAKTRGGWLRSGDLAWRDAEGWIYFVSRKDYEIRRNGEFIAPGFVEKEIATHPAVSDVFVYGIDNAALGAGEKDIVAAVVWADEEQDPGLLFDYCAARMERNSVPGYVQVVNEIPKTASEKPQQRLLVELFRSNPSSVHRPGKS